MKTILKKIVGVSMAAAMLMGMSVSAFADTNVYAMFCKDGDTSVSMTQMAIDGPATIVENTTDNTVTVTLPLDGFQYTKMGITAVGYLETLTLGSSNVATAVYGSDTDGDGYDNGTITFTIASKLYDVDGETYIDSNVKAKLSILSGLFEREMTSAVDLYFTTTEPVYTE